MHVTPPDEYAYLWSSVGGPVLGGGIVSWPIRAAPAGPFPAGTGTIATRSTACAWPWPVTRDGGGVEVQPRCHLQQWTGYNDGTLRINGKCLEATGLKVASGSR